MILLLLFFLLPAFTLPSPFPSPSPFPPTPPPLITEHLLSEFSPLSNLHQINHTTSLSSPQLAQLKTSTLLTPSDPNSNYFLGLAHLYGLSSLPPSAVSASKFFRISAEAGSADAACALGLLLYFGIGGVGRDSKAANAWFSIASLADHPRGHWLLGRSYYEGRASIQIEIEIEIEIDVNGGDQQQQNFDEAGRLFGLAAAAAVPEAIHHLGLMFEYGLIATSAAVSSEVSKEVSDVIVIVIFIFKNKNHVLTHPHPHPNPRRAQEYEEALMFKTPGSQHLPNFRKAKELYQEVSLNEESQH